MPSPIRQQVAQPVSFDPASGARTLMNSAAADQMSGRVLDNRSLSGDLTLHSTDHAQIWTLTSPDSGGRLVTDWFRICDVHGLAQEFVREADALRTRCPQCEVDEVSGPWRSGYRLTGLYARVTSQRK